MKKRESKINLILIILLTLILINLTLINSEEQIKDIDNNGIIDEKDIAYHYGKNLDDFIIQKETIRESVLKNEESRKEFLKAVESSEENKKKFIELWSKKDNQNKPLISDKSKNSLWQQIVKNEKSEDYLKQITNNLFHKSYDSQEEIQKITLQNPEKLVWQENKIGIKNNEDELTLWLDLEKTPFWMREINFNGENFDCKFNTGTKIKNIKFSGGTIGKSGELIRPDGKRVGAQMNEGIQSIKYDNANKQFIVKYNFMNGEAKTLTIGESDLTSEVRNQLMGTINDNGEVGKIIRDVLGKVDNLGIDFRQADKGGVPTQNMLNVLYEGESKPNNGPETIEINYDENNNPKVDVKNSGTLVTTNAHGEIERIYEQWAYNEGSENEAGAFVFDSTGEIKAAQNGMIHVRDVGTAYTSRVELIGVNIARNSLVDAIARNDQKAVLEAVFAKGEKIVDDLGASLSIREVLDAGYEVGSPEKNLAKVQQELLGILKQELENPELAIEYKTQIQSAIQKITSNLEQSGKNLLEYSFTRGKEQSQLTESERKIIQETTKSAANEIKSAITDLLSDPEQLKNLVKYNQKTITNSNGEKETIYEYYGNNEETNKFLREYLKQRTSSIVDTFGTNTPVETMNSVLYELKDLIGQQESLSNNAELIKKINAEIDKIDFQKEVETAIGQSKKQQNSEWKSSLQSQISTILSPHLDNPQPISSAISSLVSEVEEKIKQETQDLQNRLRQDFTEQDSKYKNNIYIDTYLNKVEVESDKVVIFDTINPLNEFKATSTRKQSDHEESVIQLWANGNRAVVFDGTETKVERINGQNYIDIEKITNTRTGDILKLSNTYYGYKIYDPSQLVMKSNNLMSVGWRRAHPIFQTIVQGPIEGDIATNPDSKVEIILGSNNPTLLTRIGFRIVGGIPVSEQSEIMKQGIATAIQSLKDSAGGEENFQNSFNEVNNFFNEIESTGAKIPQLITDTAYMAEHLDELNKIADALASTPPLGLRDKIVITGTYMQIGGSRKIQMSPEIHRMILRATAANPINRHWSIRKAISMAKKEPELEDFF